MADVSTTNRDGDMELAHTGTDLLAYPGGDRAGALRGIGTVLDGVKTAAEVIDLAHLDWDVETQPVYHLTDEGYNEIPNRRAIIRADTREVFNVMGNQFTPVQNRDAFQFFDSMVANGEAVYHMAGSLNGGKTVWIVAKLPGGLTAIGEDVMEKWVLLANGHDGERAFSMKVIPHRIACTNMLNGALKGADRFWAAHTKGVMNRVAEAREFLGLADNYFITFMAGVEKMVQTPMRESQLNPFLLDVFQLEKDRDVATLKGTTAQSFDAIHNLFNNGAGQDLPGVAETRWAAYNAVTEYVDHLRPANGGQSSFGSQDPEHVNRRISGAWFGTGEIMKRRAFGWLTSAQRGRPIKVSQ